MVGPLPHKSPHQSGILIKGVNIFLDCARAIPHGVGVLAHDERLLPILLFAKFDHIIHGRIHPAEDIGSLGLLVRFIVNEAGRINTLDLVVHSLMVSAVEGFIAKRPHDDARLILVPHHHLLGSVYIRGLPLRVVRNITCWIPSHFTKSVALEIGFVEDPQP